MMLPS